VSHFAPQRNNVVYLTEGGQETEIMYRHGHDLPEFAMYPLLENPAAVADLKTMYVRVLEIAAEFGFVAMISGLDYRASPDWGEKLGYSRAGLAEAQEASIVFLRDVAKPFRGQIDQILIGGSIGPRGDAYSLNRAITADEAEDYHGFQLEVLKRVGVDFASAMTFNNGAGSSRCLPCGSTSWIAVEHGFCSRQQSPAEVRQQPEGSSRSRGRRNGRRQAGLLRHQLLTPPRVRTRARARRLDPADPQLETQRKREG
jgi:hypothetical protein